MAQDAQLISQAGQVESLASDGLVSVSQGAGQPSKNITLENFANSMGAAVPLQQTSEQVSITGLYARTNDGKMVELTSESVASVMARLFPFQGHMINYDKSPNSVSFFSTLFFMAGLEGNPDTDTQWIITTYVSYKESEVYWFGYQTAYSEDRKASYIRDRWGSNWRPWIRQDNFGCNTLDELAVALKPKLGL